MYRKRDLFLASVIGHPRTPCTHLYASPECYGPYRRDSRRTTQRDSGGTECCSLGIQAD